MDELGIPVLCTREPGGTAGAEAIRTLLVSGEADWEPLAEAMLHFAARREHVEKFIRPAVAGGTWVLCDRFFDSTVAYQCYGQGVSLDDETALRRLAIDDLQPDLTLLLDLGRRYVNRSGWTPANAEKNVAEVALAKRAAAAAAKAAPAGDAASTDEPAEGGE